tara:strand:+ start:320 stop:463 length:144 start_codon:yes stop_codon:yes gene_type:complete
VSFNEINNIDDLERTKNKLIRKYNINKKKYINDTFSVRKQQIEALLN